MKTSSNPLVIISTVLTVILLLLLTALAFFMQIILMNGVMSSTQTNTALSISLACQGINLLLGAILAGWLSRLFLTRFQMNKALAVILAVLPIIVLAGTLSFIAIFVGLAAAGII